MKKIITKILKEKTNLSILSHGKIENGDLTASTISCDIQIKNFCPGVPDGIYSSSELVNYIENGEMPTQEKDFDISEFPEIHEISGDALGVLDWGKFSSLIPYTSYENDKYSLTGVYIEKERVVTIDGRRMKMYSHDLNLKGLEDDGYILSKNFLNSLELTAPEIRFSEDKKRFFLREGDMTFSGEILGGKFPNYKMFIPKTFENKATFDSAFFSEYIKRYKKFFSAERVIIRFTQGKCLLSYIKDGSGKRPVFFPCEYSGEPITFGFNYKFLLDALTASKFVTFHFNNERAQVKISSEEKKEFTEIVMPMQVRETELAFDNAKELKINVKEKKINKKDAEILRLKSEISALSAEILALKK